MLEQDSFTAFWTSYPRRVGKFQAQKIWKRIQAQIRIDEVLAGIERWKETKQWQDPDYIPYPATFLNQRRWEDKPLAARKTLERVEAHVGAGPLERAPRICAKCGATGSWHLNAAKRGTVDHPFQEAM